MIYPAFCCRKEKSTLVFQSGQENTNSPQEIAGTYKYLRLFSKPDTFAGYF
jgi:hypothetical protein